MWYPFASVFKSKRFNFNVDGQLWKYDWSFRLRSNYIFFHSVQMAAEILRKLVAKGRQMLRRRNVSYSRCWCIVTLRNIYSIALPSWLQLVGDPEKLSTRVSISYLELRWRITCYYFAKGLHLGLFILFQFCDRYKLKRQKRKIS